MLTLTEAEKREVSNVIQIETNPEQDHPACDVGIRLGFLAAWDAETRAFELEREAFRFDADPD